MCKAALYEDEDFVVTGEVIGEHLFVHITVHRYNKTIRKRIFSVWGDIKDEAWVNGWDRVFSYNTNEKFAKLLSGRVVDEKLRVFAWEL